MKLVAALAVTATLSILAACSDGADGTTSGGPPDGGTTTETPVDGGVGPADGDAAAASDAAASDAGADGAAADGGPDAGVPAVQYIGRFDFTDPAAPRTAWPGARIIARFSGTGASATFSSAGGGDGNATWLNVFVDGAAKPKVLVDGANVPIVLATGLAAGPHTVEVEKRTEASLGTLTFHGFSFEGAGQLMPPPARASRRIEFLSESTIDGFGVDGDLNTTCMGGAPAEYNDARKSLAFYVAKGLSAEHHLIAQSGKGILTNTDPSDTAYFPSIYLRTLAEDPAVLWTFSSWTPDVVVISLGGVDLGEGTAPSTAFNTGYDALVTSIRSRHPNAHVFMTVWSQVKAAGRTNLKAALDAVKAAHPTDTKLHVFQFAEATYPTDETGCYYHANDAHHQETAAELVPAIKAATGW